VVLSRHDYDEVWSLVRTADRKVHLEIPELLQELASLSAEARDTTPPAFVLMAGERRSYNANQIFRDPAWRKVDRAGALRMHPDDAARLGLVDGDHAVVQSATGELDVVVEVDDSVRPGMVTLPHGYGVRYGDGAPIGPAINRLTSSAHCDPHTRTPYHKHVPVSIRRRRADAEPRATA
jgi:anaerobic selenocysteine-containing dehydrogenase